MAPCLQYLRAHPETLRELTDHLGTTSVAEVVVQIAGADDVTACYLGPAQLAWLSESHLMDLILQQLYWQPLHAGEDQAVPACWMLYFSVCLLQLSFCTLHGSA